MNAVELFFIGLIVFWASLYLLRKRLEGRGFQIYPFLLLWKKGTRSEWFPNLARKKSYKTFEKAALALGIISMLGGISLVVYVFINLLNAYFISPSQVAQAQAPKLTPIIPGITIGLNQVPWLLLAIGISVTLHELAHAVSATSNKIKVKGGGFLLLLFFPGAFVEPDEDEFIASSLTAKLKVISAGIAINLILAALFFPLVFYVPPIVSQGLQIVAEVPHYPAYNASIPINSVIIKVDNHTVTTPQQLGYYLDQSIRQEITLLLPNGSIITKAINTTPDHKIGVYITYYYPPLLYSILDFAYWMFTINFSLALLNGAPLIITDGGKIFTELIKRIGLGENVSYTIQGVLLLILIGAIILSISPPQ
ncbi:site-2 protease family protein [Stygiolobus caldivivus]|uniref:S2P metalloprotease n=1 Tax=Stygiolobus caldivivus TaxID=2824673 RepID=A0A8D5ZI81_9CREN|nr:site-2 protease family protein [Stygiolobus caldivivus]BCU69210.1 S2P metalloprotease [Stygiolobus caldivivus]